MHTYIFISLLELNCIISTYHSEQDKWQMRQSTKACITDIELDIGSAVSAGRTRISYINARVLVN
jgi:hypothetical protein